MGWGTMVRRWRLAAVGLVVIGALALAAPVPVLGLDCGSPIAVRHPTAADAWRDAYELRAVLEDCPRHLRARRGAGAAALLGAVVAAVVPAVVARRSGER